MTAVEQIRALPGDHVSEVISRAVRRANEADGRQVRFTFNDVVVTVQPGQSAAQVEQEWDRGFEEMAAAYRASPEGQHRAAEAAAELDRLQREHDALVAMPIATLSECALMDWLARYTDAADHTGIKGKNTAAVADALEAVGYRRSDAVGLPKTEYENPRVIARYIAGQAIDCLRIGMGPHPVIHKFIKEYRRLAA